MNTLGAEVRVIAPATLIPKNKFWELMFFYEMKKGLQNIDIIIMLGLQLEKNVRILCTFNKRILRYYGLDRDKLNYASPDALILHPGPMNRGVEIDSELADDLDRSAIFDQVQMGVAVRMACLKTIVENKKKKMQNKNPFDNNKKIKKSYILKTVI